MNYIDYVRVKSDSCLIQCYVYCIFLIIITDLEELDVCYTVYCVDNIISTLNQL